MLVSQPAAAAAIPLVIFMFVSSITPGPNNLMLMNSGVRFGLRRTVPHIVGVNVGLALVMTLTYVGFGALLLSRPGLLRLMTVACALYLLWLAAALLRSTASAPGGAEKPAAQRAMRSTEAILFQFINPKVWAMTVTACSLAAAFPWPPSVSLLLLVALSTAVNFPCVSVWAVFGDRLRRQLQNARFRLAFNAAMATLVVGTAAWMASPVMKEMSAGMIVNSPLTW